MNLTNKQHGMALMDELLGHNVLYLGSVPGTEKAANLHANSLK